MGTFDRNSKISSFVSYTATVVVALQCLLLCDTSLLVTLSGRNSCKPFHHILWRLIRFSSLTETNWWGISACVISFEFRNRFTARIASFDHCVTQATIINERRSRRHGATVGMALPTDEYENYSTMSISSTPVLNVLLGSLAYVVSLEDVSRCFFFNN